MLPRSPRRYGARIKVAEVPPGPPVLQTLVAEVYGPSDQARHRPGSKDSRDFRNAPTAWWTSTGMSRTISRKPTCRRQRKGCAERHTPKTISHTRAGASAGYSAGLLHQPREKEDVNIMLDLPRALRQRRRNCSRYVFAPAMPTRCLSLVPQASRRSCRSANW